jgi:hypothetical protein
MLISVRAVNIDVQIPWWSTSGLARGVLAAAYINRDLLYLSRYARGNRLILLVGQVYMVFSVGRSLLLVELGGRHGYPTGQK